MQTTFKNNKGQELDIYEYNEGDRPYIPFAENQVIILQDTGQSYKIERITYLFTKSERRDNGASSEWERIITCVQI